MRETIGWIEQAGTEAFFCCRNKDGSKGEFEIIEMKCRAPNGGGGGGGVRQPNLAPLKVAA